MVTNDSIVNSVVTLYQDIIASLICLQQIHLNFNRIDRGKNVVDNIRFPFLFNNLKGLASVKLDGLIEYKYSTQYSNALVGDAEMNNESLETLDIRVECIDILCLKFIIKKLSKIQSTYCCGQRCCQDT